MRRIIPKPKRPQLSRCHQCKALIYYAFEDYQHEYAGKTWILQRLIAVDQLPSQNGAGVLLTFKRKAGYLYVDEDQTPTGRKRYTRHTCKTEATK